MQTPLEIIFTDTDRSPAAETYVRERVERLERRYDRITSCHVFVAAPHRQHRKGNAYEVRIELRLPGTELAVNNRPGDDDAHADPYVAIRDAFNAMESQLEQWKGRVQDPRS
jgi:ribosomal subunit interface protein